MNKYPKLTIVLLVTVTQLALHALRKREDEMMKSPVSTSKMSGAVFES